MPCGLVAVVDIAREAQPPDVVISPSAKIRKMSLFWLLRFLAYEICLNRNRDKFAHLIFCRRLTTHPIAALFSSLFAWSGVESLSSVVLQVSKDFVVAFFCVLC